MTGRLDIQENIKETTGYGSNGYVLTFNISDFGGFSEVVTSRHPEACFVFRRSKPGEPLTNPFKGVCTVNDFFTIPYTVSGDDVANEGLYRSGSFVKEYPDYNSSLADRNTILSKISAYVNNLNAYVNSHSGSESTRRYILPDYEQGLLDDMIATYRGLKAENDRDTLIIATMERDILPMLSSNKLVYTSLLEAAEILERTADNKPAMLTGFNTLNTEVQFLDTTLATYLKTQTQARNTFSSVINTATVIEGIISTAGSDIDDDVRDSINTYLKELKADAESGGYDVAVEGHASIKSMKSNILPAVARIQDTVLAEFVDTTAVQQLMAAINDFGSSIDSRLLEYNGQVSALTEAIEFRKGEMQVLEAKMKQIRPSLDITNPESAWYFTVNLEV